MIALDQLITRLLFDLIPHSVAGNIFFMFFSAVGSFALVWVVLGILLIVFEEKKHHEFVVFFLGGLVATFLFTEFLIKPIVHRPRPYSGVISQPVDYSFPSTHAATSFFAAALLSFYHKRKRALFLSLAFIISFSRIYLGVHYFGDVLFGAIIGLLVAFAMSNLKFEIQNLKLHHGVCEITPKRGHTKKRRNRGTRK